MDYVHANSSRISASVRKVLRFPADNLRVRLDQGVKDLGDRREDTIKVRGESERAASFFGGLVVKTDTQRGVVNEVELDTPPQAVH